MLIKTFKSHKLSELQEQVNEFFDREKPSELFDVQYAIRQSYIGNEKRILASYTVIIIYEPRES